MTLQIFEDKSHSKIKFWWAQKYFQVKSQFQNKQIWLLYDQNHVLIISQSNLFVLIVKIRKLEKSQSQFWFLKIKLFINTNTIKTASYSILNIIRSFIPCFSIKITTFNKSGIKIQNSKYKLIQTLIFQNYHQTIFLQQ